MLSRDVHRDLERLMAKKVPPVQKPASKRPKSVADKDRSNGSARRSSPATPTAGRS